MTLNPSPLPLSVTCVIPTHYRHDFLEQALDSVSKQVLQPRRTIVVSDAPDIVAQNLCAQLSLKLGMEIDYIESSAEERGASSSRNIGAFASNDPYLAFLDDDDLWHPDYLKSALQCFAKQNVSLVATQIVEFSDKGRRLGIQIAPGLKAKEAAAMNVGVTGSSFIIQATKFHELGGFDAALPVKNDTDFFFRFLREGNEYGVVAEQFVLQRKHTLGQLTAKTAARAAGIELYIKKHQEHLSWKDLRVLRLSMHRTLAAASKDPLQRAWHLLNMTINYPLQEIGRLIRSGRNKDYFNVEAF